MSPDKAPAKRMTGKYKDLIFGFPQSADFRSTCLRSCSSQLTTMFQMPT